LPINKFCQIWVRKQNVKTRSSKPAFRQNKRSVVSEAGEKELLLSSKTLGSRAMGSFNRAAEALSSRSAGSRTISSAIRSSRALPVSEKSRQIKPKANSKVAVYKTRSVNPKSSKTVKSPGKSKNIPQKSKKPVTSIASSVQPNTKELAIRQPKTTFAPFP